MSDKPNWVAEAKARCDAATPGPWRPDVGIYGDPDGDEDLGYARTPMVTRRHSEPYKVFKNRIQPQADFIAAARTDLPRALAVIEAADRLADAYEAMDHGHHLSCSYAASGGSACPTGECGCHFKAIDAALAAYRTARL